MPISTGFNDTLRFVYTVNNDVTYFVYNKHQGSEPRRHLSPAYYNLHTKPDVLLLWECHRQKATAVRKYYLKVNSASCLSQYRTNTQKLHQAKKNDLA